MHQRYEHKVGERHGISAQGRRYYVNQIASVTVQTTIPTNYRLHTTRATVNNINHRPTTT
jgi:hypothetical protein